MSNPTKQAVFNEGLQEGASKGKAQDLSGFFTPYPNNAQLRSEWVKGFKQGFKQETGVDYPPAASVSERLDLFFEQLEALNVAA